MKNVKMIIAGLIIAMLLGLTFTSCDNSLSGEGDQYEYSPLLNEFTSIAISVPADINIQKSETSQITLSAQQNIIDNMAIYVDQNTLYMHFTKEVDNFSPITIDLSLPSLLQTDISGTSEIHIMDSFSGDYNMRLSLSGNSKVYFLDDISCKNFYYEVSGDSYFKASSLEIENKYEAQMYGNNTVEIDYINSSEVNYNINGKADVLVSGQTDLQSIENAGVSNYNSSQLNSKKTAISSTGSGTFVFNPNNILDQNITKETILAFK